MAGPDISQILLNEGKLYYGVSSFTTAPYGGKLLGYVEDVAIRWNVRTTRRRAPDTNRVYEIAVSGQEADLVFTLTQWDPDLISIFFPRVTTTGSPTSSPGMARVEGMGQPRVLAALQPILFCPDDPRHLAVVFLRPLPDPSLAKLLNLSRSDPAVTSVGFTASLNDSWNAYYVDRLEQLKIT